MYWNYSLENINSDNANIDTISDLGDNFFYENIFDPHNNYEDTSSTSSHPHLNYDIADQAEINLEGYDQDGLPRFCSFNDIFSLLKIIMPEQSIQKIFNEGKNVENSQHYNFLKNKRKNFIKGCSNEDINSAQTKRGRKTNKCKNSKRHGKKSPDNIYRKIKQRLLKYALKFLNEILDLKGDNKLVKLNYEDNISDLQREKDLMYLNMSLKDIFSSDISDKYSKRKKTFNKDKIEEIINAVPLDVDQTNHYTKQFALNLKYGDFIYLFTKKKKVIDIVQSDENSAFINCELIEKSLCDITDFIKDEKEKHDAEYFCLMLFYFYNLERYFNMKQIRKKRN